jgi:hypothetical protein
MDGWIVYAYIPNMLWSNVLDLFEALSVYLLKCAITSRITYRTNRQSLPFSPYSISDANDSCFRPDHTHSVDIFPFPSQSLSCRFPHPSSQKSLIHTYQNPGNSHPFVSFLPSPIPSSYQCIYIDLPTRQVPQHIIVSYEHCLIIADWVTRMSLGRVDEVVLCLRGETWHVFASDWKRKGIYSRM